MNVTAFALTVPSGNTAMAAVTIPLYAARPLTTPFNYLENKDKTKLCVNGNIEVVVL